VAVQCVVLCAIAYASLPLNGAYGACLRDLMAVCLLTGWVGMALGLFISVRSRSSEAAVGVLPLMLIPQIVFGGLMVPVREMEPWALAAFWFMVVRYAFEASLKTVATLTEVSGTLGEPVQRPIAGILYHLRFKSTAAADDTGIPLPWLLGILAAGSAKRSRWRVMVWLEAAARGRACVALPTPRSRPSRRAR